MDGNGGVLYLGFKAHIKEQPKPGKELGISRAKRNNISGDLGNKIKEMAFKNRTKTFFKR